MNDFGEFLYTLRKEKGMTQSSLAEKLGVTNKAVSKWETGEAMPETAQLLPISRIFGVSVDELLAGKRSEPVKEEQEENIRDNLFTRGKDDKDEKTPLEKIQGAACSIVVFAGIFAYLMLGIIGGLWHPFWVIIPVCAFFSGVIGCVFDLFNSRKKKAKIAKGENPYVGAVCGILMLTCLIMFMLLGAFLNLWHPLWILVVAGGLVCAFIGMLGEIINLKK